MDLQKTTEYKVRGSERVNEVWVLARSSDRMLLDVAHSV